MKTYRDLHVWQKSMQMVTAIYDLTKTFPKEEVFGLTAQIRRSAVSIPSNIAEGYGRQTKNELSRYLSISVGSLFEFQTQLEIARNINYLNDTDFKLLYDKSRELEIMIKTFIRNIKP